MAESMFSQLLRERDPSLRRASRVLNTRRRLTPRLTLAREADFSRPLSRLAP